MRTTLNINDDLLARARRFSGIKEKTAVIHAALEALVERQAALHLASMRGTQKNMKVPRRRRPDFALVNRKKRGSNGSR